ncbi:hypothetical protein FRC12_006672 [Ceratobasidium sp. 428]|nr:hypothetical protein FRC12_006672 [Ceratobasidium sp. 428]
MKSTSLLYALASALAVSAGEFPHDNTYANPLLAKVLLYTYTDGFRHDSIPTAIAQLKDWGPYWNVSFYATEEQDYFTTANLAQYDAIMCVHSTGNIFSTAGQAAFADYLNKGGNFAAIHAASAGYLDKPWAPYTNALGATFDHHPKRQDATFIKEMHDHPATNPTLDQWRFEEEVYSFTSDPRGKNGAKLLYSVDPNSYNDSGTVAAQGTPHPIAWVQEYNAGAVVSAAKSGPGIPGRSFYSSLGHLNETWQNSTFMHHVMGGLIWTFGSNTTQVAGGIYGGAEPTIHTGATNNNTAGVVGNWNAVLGSNETAPPPPPPPPSPSSSGNGPEASGSSSSGALSDVNVPRSMVWAIAAALVGASTL